MQFKKRKNILIALLCLNLFAALNMIFLNSFSAAYITFFAILEMIINYFFECKGKEIPKSLVALYIICNIIIGSLTFTGPLDTIPIAAAIIFCFTILTKNEQNIRKLMFVNQCLWLIFDISVGAYTLVCSNILTLVSTAIAYYRYGKATKKTSHKKSSPKKTTSNQKHS
jgi:hypothetical protein